MTWIQIGDRLPKPFARVWVKTDAGREVTGYVKSDGEWVINCPRIRNSGAIVLQWRE